MWVWLLKAESSLQLTARKGTGLSPPNAKKPNSDKNQVSLEPPGNSAVLTVSVSLRETLTKSSPLGRLPA